MALPDALTCFVFRFLRRPPEHSAQRLTNATVPDNHKGTRLAARRADVGDKMLFKALSAEGNPTLTTVHKVLHAMGCD